MSDHSEVCPWRVEVPRISNNFGCLFSSGINSASKWEGQEPETRIAQAENELG